MNDNQLIARVEKVEKDIADLKKAVFGDSHSKPVKKGGSYQELDFSLNIRAFIKRYAGGKSGPKRFILLLAYLTKGEVGVDIGLDKIGSEWKKMTKKSNTFEPVAQRKSTAFA